MSQAFLHEHSGFKDLLQITADEQSIKDPSLVEKDYWIMHCLWAMQQVGLQFELKGGTALSKGFGAIYRFSEDIDIRIEPNEKITLFKVFSNKNHDDDKHRESRKKYFDWLTTYLQNKLPGIKEVIRDENFDDPVKYRNGGIRLIYTTKFPIATGLKDGILLEVGFDNTAPNLPCDITSWALEKALASKVPVLDNNATAVACFEPKYNFVEKLQAVVRKYRLFSENKNSNMLPTNFLRHYYDIYLLLDRADVQSFIGTNNYEAYKKERFKGDDTKISKSNAFWLTDPAELELFLAQYKKTATLYYKEQPDFLVILKKIQKIIEEL